MFARAFEARMEPDTSLICMRPSDSRPPARHRRPNRVPAETPAPRTGQRNPRRPASSGSSHEASSGGCDSPPTSPLPLPTPLLPNAPARRLRRGQSRSRGAKPDEGSGPFAGFDPVSCTGLIKPRQAGDGRATEPRSSPHGSHPASAGATGGCRSGSGFHLGFSPSVLAEPFPAPPRTRPALGDFLSTEI